MELKLTIEHTINQEYIDTLLTTFFEGGCTWAKCFIESTNDEPVILNKNDIDAYQWYANNTGNWQYCFGDADTNRYFEVGEKVSGVSPVIGDDGKNQVVTLPYRHLNVSTLKEGLETFAKVNGFPELGDIDYDAADCIIQLSIFGCYVYG